MQQQHLQTYYNPPQPAQGENLNANHIGGNLNTGSAVNPNNHLLRIVTPLLTLLTQLRYTTEHPNVASLRAQVVEEIKIVEHKLSQQAYPLKTIIATRYALCTAIDEAVLSQDWGTQSVWVSGSLLSLFQKETWGGERFYIILEDSLRDTTSNIDFIELIYFLMSLGFEGKYYGDEQRNLREEIRGRIFYHIRHARMKPERNLSLNWKNRAISKGVRQRKNLLKRVGILTLFALCSLLFIYNLKVYYLAQPTLKKLNAIGSVSPITSFSQIIERPIVIRDEKEGQ
jgi:type VI secretion system protein ImpK